MSIEVVREIGGPMTDRDEFLDRLQSLCTEFNVMLVGGEQTERRWDYAIHAVHERGAYEFVMVHPRPQVNDEP